MWYVSMCMYMALYLFSRCWGRRFLGGWGELGREQLNKVVWN